MKNPELEENFDPNILIPIHVGLLGHIDAGKTAIARCLTEIQSTSGLDKHPQSQERGITIDLGFTFFPLKEYMITLVDVPGHADLIKSVVSGVNIIDLGVLVVDGTQGPQVQTGEHLVILDLLEIQHIIVVINKIDLMIPSQIKDLRNSLKKLMESTRFKSHHSVIPVSAQENMGIEELKKEIYQSIQNISISRNQDGSLIYLIDHHFGKKGKGTVVTGTVLEGKAKVGDELTVLPIQKKVKIKSIQKWKQTVSELKAGDRCGVSLNGISPSELFRGCMLINHLEEFVKSQWITIKTAKVPMFKHSCKFGQDITITHNMRVIHGRIFPFTIKNDGKRSNRIWINPKKSKTHFQSLIWLDELEYLKENDRVLLTRLDLSPKTLRIMGLGVITSIPTSSLEFFKQKRKYGKIKNVTYSLDSIIVEGLAQSQKGAHSLLKCETTTPPGTIISSFGQKGNVEIKLHNLKLKKDLTNGDKVIFEQYKSFVIDPKKSYEFLV